MSNRYLRSIWKSQHLVKPPVPPSPHTATEKASKATGHSSTIPLLTNQPVELEQENAKGKRPMSAEVDQEYCPSTKRVREDALSTPTSSEIPVSAGGNLEFILEEHKSKLGSRTAGISMMNPTILDSSITPQAWEKFLSTVSFEDHATLLKKDDADILRLQASLLLSLSQTIYSSAARHESLSKRYKRSKSSSSDLKKKIGHLDEKMKEVSEKVAVLEQEVAAKDGRIAELEAKLEQKDQELAMKLKEEAANSFELGRQEGLSTRSEAIAAERKAVVTEFFNSVVYEELVERQSGIDLSKVFEKGWKQCRALGFLNDRFDETKLSATSDENGVPLNLDFLIEDDPKGVPEDHEFGFLLELQAAKLRAENADPGGEVPESTSSDHVDLLNFQTHNDC